MKIVINISIVLCLLAWIIRGLQERNSNIQSASQCKESLNNECFTQKQLSHIDAPQMYDSESRIDKSDIHFVENEPYSEDIYIYTEWKGLKALYSIGFMVLLSLITFINTIWILRKVNTIFKPKVNFEIPINQNQTTAKQD